MTLRLIVGVIAIPETSILLIFTIIHHCRDAKQS